ncbi:MAG: STAS/SEC14 domain-containing protein [Acidobacteria bacterium]|nr:STAS/SEC14 domain-containing protein [Acidobacteriota bacterium]
MEQSESQLTADKIIAEVERLPLPELNQLVDRVIAIQAAGKAPHLTADETALLRRINQGLSAADRVRMRELIKRRDEERISDSELRVLTALTDRLELVQAERLAALVELARQRGITLNEMMDQLGISFPDHD